jgi:hypothetical protein
MEKQTRIDTEETQKEKNEKSTNYFNIKKLSQRFTLPGAPQTPDKLNHVF